VKEELRVEPIGDLRYLKGKGLVDFIEDRNQPEDLRDFFFEVAITYKGVDLVESRLNEPLISATENGYCFMLGNFGPAWETWTLQPSDYLTIPAAGAYWIAVLPEQSYGTIYHFTYTGLFPSEALYTYGYYMYAFPASYTLGFPRTVFAAVPAYGYVIQPSNSGNVGNYNAPYSLYVTGS